MNSVNCHQCLNVRAVPGNCHVQCSKPDKDIVGNLHGIKNGWFYYPLLYDPIWIENASCNNFELSNRSTNV